MIDAPSATVGRINYVAGCEPQILCY